VPPHFNGFDLQRDRVRYPGESSHNYAVLSSVRDQSVVATRESTNLPAPAPAPDVTAAGRPRVFGLVAFRSSVGLVRAGPGLACDVRFVERRLAATGSDRMGYGAVP